jgi:hypothetical protein
LNQPVIKRYAKATIDNVTLVCRTGGPTSPELDFARYVILVISAQSWDTRKIAASWLKEVRSLKNLVSLGIVLKGSERCTNDWLLPYLKDQTVFRIRFMFTIYGYSYGYGKGIGFPQDRLFLWPLGVAAIRGFPKATLRPVLAEPEGAKRKYLCNFLGTLHSHALARKQVVRILRDPRHKHWKCFLKYRDEWTKSESHQSMAQYVDTLKNTDFTLCPAGNNVESFRIYEAMSFGSVPVLLHDVVIKKGDLQDSTYKCTGAFELLKFHSAPVIWLNSWSELPTVMENLLAETPAETYQRRFTDTLHSPLRSHFFQAEHRRVVSPVFRGYGPPVRPQHQLLVGAVNRRKTCSS